MHILFGDVVVEVSTFRCEPRLAPPAAADETAPELLITSDNSFGTAVEDAFRRDFTVNALFYNIADFSILDYVGGMEDLDDRALLRTIGDPQVRFREDPVRMLRACELAGRLDFTIEASSQAAIHDLRQELTKASPARVSEELVALLRCGSSGKAMQWMLDLGSARGAAARGLRHGRRRASAASAISARSSPRSTARSPPAGRSRTAVYWRRSFCPAFCCAASTSRLWRGRPCAASNSP